MEESNLINVCVSVNSNEGKTRLRFPKVDANFHHLGGLRNATCIWPWCQMRQYKIYHRIVITSSIATILFLNINNYSPHTFNSCYKTILNDMSNFNSRLNYLRFTLCVTHTSRFVHVSKITCLQHSVY